MTMIAGKEGGLGGEVAHRPPAPSAHTHTQATCTERLRATLLEEARRLGAGPHGFPLKALVAKVAADTGAPVRTTREEAKTLPWLDRRLTVVEVPLQGPTRDARGRQRAVRVEERVFYDTEGSA